LDGADVHTGDVVPLLNRIARIEHRTSALLPGTKLDSSPALARIQYLPQGAIDSLERLWYAQSRRGGCYAGLLCRAALL
jgi:hypothetical protein